MEKLDKTKEDKQWEEQYNEKDYQKTIYSFTSTELGRLAPWDAQIQIGQIASQVLTGILRKEVLKRVGQKNSPDSGIRYDISTGQFFVYAPKNWCSLCKIKKAEFSVKEAIYCSSCIEILKQQAEKGKKTSPTKN